MHEERIRQRTATKASTKFVERGWLDKPGVCAMGNSILSSLSWLSFLKANAGDPNSSNGSSRAGRKAAGNRGQGHFLDRARQLTSPAMGRAIL
jgi:hypothetical protein